jgi:hypothetical protein
VKEKLLEVTRSHTRAVADIQKRLGRYSGARVQAGSLLSDVQGVSSIWFDQVRPALEVASFPAGFIGSGTDVFDRLLREAKKRKPMKAALTALIAEGLSLYSDLIHNIEVSSFATPSLPMWKACQRMRENISQRLCAA